MNTQNSAQEIVKQRSIWNLRAWQLLREQRTSRYAVRKMPQMIRNVHIRIPRSKISVGLRVTSRSEFIAGENMLPLLYDSRTRGEALSMALIALDAFEGASIGENDFAWFSKLFRLRRSWKMRAIKHSHQLLLSTKEKRALADLHSAVALVESPSLVHGDLHAGNLIVDFQNRSLGILDLELLHIGHPAINFAQLWIAFFFADPRLGGQLYHAYAQSHPWIAKPPSERVIKAEIVLRCYSMIETGNQKPTKSIMKDKSLQLLKAILSVDSFQQLWSGGNPNDVA